MHIRSPVRNYTNYFWWHKIHSRILSTRCQRPTKPNWNTVCCRQNTTSEFLTRAEKEKKSRAIALTIACAPEKKNCVCTNATLSKPLQLIHLFHFFLVCMHVHCSHSFLSLAFFFSFILTHQSKKKLFLTMNFSLHHQKHWMNFSIFSIACDLKIDSTVNFSEKTRFPHNQPREKKNDFRLTHQFLL